MYSGIRPQPVLAACCVLCLAQPTAGARQAQMEMRGVPLQHPPSPRPAIAARTPYYLMGIVRSVTPGSYFVETGGMGGPTWRVVLARQARLYLLSPGSIAAAVRGWAAHAIGQQRGNAVDTRILVLFPPATRDGVPPESAGMSGVGTLVGTNPMTLRDDRGRLLRIVTTSTTAVRVAHPMPASALRPGDFAMNFGAPGKSVFIATVVHVRRDGSAMMGGAGGAMRSGR